MSSQETASISATGIYSLVKFGGGFILEAHPLRRVIKRESAWCAIMAALEILRSSNNEAAFQAIVRDARLYELSHEPGNVYFIQAGERGLIKIGFTNGPTERRLASLQTGNGANLRLLGSSHGGPALERRIHELLRRHRVRGEWFAFHPDILDWAESPLGALTRLRETNAVGVFCP